MASDLDNSVKKDELVEVDLQFRCGKTGKTHLLKGKVRPEDGTVRYIFNHGDHNHVLDFVIVNEEVRSNYTFFDYSGFFEIESSDIKKDSRLTPASVEQNKHDHLMDAVDDFSKWGMFDEFGFEYKGNDLKFNVPIKIVEEIKRNYLNKFSQLFSDGVLKGIPSDISQKYKKNFDKFCEKLVKKPGNISKQGLISYLEGSYAKIIKKSGDRDTVKNLNFDFVKQIALSYTCLFEYKEPLELKIGDVNKKYDLVNCLCSYNGDEFKINAIQPGNKFIEYEVFDMLV